VNTSAITHAVNLTTGQDSAGNVSLRSATEAINAAGASTPALITFDIPNTDSGYQPCTNSFQIMDSDSVNPPVVIAVYTQPGAIRNTLAYRVGNNAVLKINLDGGTGGYDGISLPDDSTVTGLAITHFSHFGVWASSNDLIVENFVGTDVSGTLAE